MKSSTIKKIVLIALVLFQVLNAGAQNQVQIKNLFAKNINTVSNTGYSSVYGITTDNNNNVIVVGTFKGTVDMDFSPTSSFILASNDESVDGFIAKYDAAYNLMWAYKYGTSKFDGGCFDVVTNANNEIFTFASISDTTIYDVDPTAIVNNTSLSPGAIATSMLLLKFNANGDLMTFSKAYGPTNFDNIIPSALTIDKLTGDVLLTGFITGNVDLVAPTGVMNIGPVSGAREVFVSRYTQNLTNIWAKQITYGTDDDKTEDITTDNNGDFIISGAFRNTVDFDPSASSYNLTSPGTGKNDAFIAKYTPNGTFIWAFQLGSTGFTSGDVGNALQCDAGNNIYVAGGLVGMVDMNPDPAVNNTLDFNAQKIFLAKYTSAGNYLWANAFGTSLTGGQLAYDMVLDATNNIYITGSASRQSDFNPSPTVVNNIGSPTNGTTYIFLASYTTNGDYLWANSFGENNNITHGSFAIWLNQNTCKSVYMGGNFQVTIDFDPCTSSTTLDATSGFGPFGQNAFLVQYKVLDSLLPKINVLQNLICLNDVGIYSGSTNLNCTSGLPVNYNWSFPGGAPATSALQNPTINYPTIGTYAVKLVANDGCRTDSIEINNFVTVGVFGTCGVLPLHFVDFKVNKNGVGLILKWDVENMYDVKHFVIEKSTNGIYFEEIGTVSATNATNYTFTLNEQSNAKNYFRIKAVEWNGKNYYSTIVLNYVEANNAINLFPSPANKFIELNIPNYQSNKNVVKIYDPTGKLIISKAIQSASCSIDISALNNGVYFLLYNSNGTTVKKQFVVMH